MKLLSFRFRALAEPFRLRLLLLLTGGERCVCDLTAATRAPQSSVSRHLAYLRNAGWITDRRTKRWTYYRLADDLPALELDILRDLAGRLAGDPAVFADAAALQTHLNSTNRHCE